MSASIAIKANNKEIVNNDNIKLGIEFAYVSKVQKHVNLSKIRDLEQTF